MKGITAFDESDDRKLIFCEPVSKELHAFHKEFEVYPDDELKYLLPEFWPTNLILTSNIRELRHILTLRTNPAALNEFRVLAYSLFEAVPEEYKYLLEDCVYRENGHD